MASLFVGVVLTSPPAQAVAPGVNGTVAFDRDGNVWLAGPDGSNQTLLHSGSDPEISPDGSKVAFVRSDGIWIINTDGSGLRRLAADSTAGWPSWSPDGHRIVYTQSSPDNQVSQLWLMDADGQNKVNVYDRCLCADPTFSPDGTKLALTDHWFVYNPATGGFDSFDGLATMNLDGTGKTLIATPSNGVPLASPSWSPDGSKLAYADNNQILFINADGTGSPHLVHQLGTSQPKQVMWSPDGQQITFDNGSNTSTHPAFGGSVARFITNANTLSWSSGNQVAPGGPVQVTFNQAAGQADPTSSGPILFDVKFGEPVTGFTASDVVVDELDPYFGTSIGGSLTTTVSGFGDTYTVSVSGMTESGDVVGYIPAGAVIGPNGVASAESTSDDASVTFNAPAPPDTTKPSVTINQASGQADPTTSGPITFDVKFSEPVTGFVDSDVSLSGTAGGTLAATVTGSSDTYTVSVSGMTSGGTVIASIPADAATDPFFNTSTASTSTDNTVTFNAPDTTKPSVTINQASGQDDPTTSDPVKFDVKFSEPVTGFTASDVSLSGTAGGTLATTVSGSDDTYVVSVSGMTSDGTVIASIPAGSASDTGGNTSTASTSTDNTVTFNVPDTTSPSVTCSASPSSLKSNDHKLVAISTTVKVTDESGGSGAAGFVLVSVTSNQADSGLGPDDVADDRQGWSTGSADTSGLLRNERYGSNRVYTLTYQGSDLAGNDTTCQTTVTVKKAN